MTMPYALYNPATHVAVPREPTQEMLRASSRGDAKRAAVYYRAMLAAAPPHVVDAKKLRAELNCAVFEAKRCDMPCKQIRGCTCAMGGANAILRLLGVER